MTAKRSKSVTLTPNGPDSPLCQFPFADGRRCRMLRTMGHPSLCLFHARDEQQLAESQQLGSQLAASFSGDFLTAADINFVLGKLFTALAQNRISPRSAATLAYIGQLMLQSIPYVKKEYSFSYSNDGWKGMLAKAVTLSDPPPSLARYAPASSPNSSPEVSISDDSSSEDSAGEPA